MNNVHQSILTDNALQLVTASEYAVILVKFALPALKNVLLMEVGIEGQMNECELMIRQQSTSEKVRVTRVKESVVLSLLLDVLIDLLKIRFESLLCHNDFGLIWSQVLTLRQFDIQSVSLMQFILSISSTDGELFKHSKESIKSLLQFSNGYAVFDVRLM